MDNNEDDLKLRMMMRLAKGLRLRQLVTMWHTLWGGRCLSVRPDTWPSIRGVHMENFAAF